jgi:phosphoribosylformylglycinamidine (FGAM) synthase-like enzyme
MGPHPEEVLMLTNHARARMQQRGIRPEVLEALLDFGREARAARGREIVFFDKKARARLARANAIAATEAERVCSSYAIVASDGKVITVGHRTRRIPRYR